LKAAEKINLLATDCYVFEDSFNGIRGANAAGCLPVMIPDTVQPTDEIKKFCTAIYPNLLDALSAIKDSKI
jgi:beta-phosphoglucomutase-like phosphatase (HAD superfamily)